MTRGQVAQKNVGSENNVPRHGSIYDRLDKARAQRVKSLSPQIAANDESLPAHVRTTARARPKSQLLPDIKPQEEFDPPTKQRVPAIIKLGLGILAFSVMAGFSLLDWNTGALPTSGKDALISDAPTSNTSP